MQYLFNNHIENDQIYVYSGGYDPTNPGHKYGPTVRSGYMIHYIYEGKGTFTSNETAYQLQKGEFFLIEPNKIISYEADEEDPWAFYWIGFRGSLVEEYMKRTSISYTNPIFHGEKTSKIKDNLSEMIELSLIHENNDLLLNAKLLEIIFQLTENFPSIDTNDSSKRKNSLFVEALQFIRNNYEQDIRIDELAQRLSIDRTYLHRLFVRELEMSPKEYLTMVRIRKAQELLTQSDLPIKLISYSVGYENTQQFSRVFKQRTGCTPSNYRLLK